MMYFPVSEYQERLVKTKQRMAGKGIDVLIVTDPANMNYLSGYDAWSFYVHQCLVVFIEEDQPYWIGRKIDASGAMHTTWLSHDHIYAYPDDYIQSTEKHPMDFVSSFIQAKRQDKKVVAAEFDSYYFTAKNLIQLQRGLPNATFKDGTNLVNWVRIIKSDNEIEFIKKASKITELAMQAAFENIDVGVKQSDAVAAIAHAQIRGTEDFGGDYPAIVPLLPTGEKTSACHLTWTDDVFNPGDPVIIELSGCYKRYHSPLARTLMLGIPDEKTQYIADVVIEGINETIAAIKPGITGEEVEYVWRKTIEKSGVKKDSRLGYSMGLNYPPDWGEHTASLRPGDKTVLQPNMTFHMIPGIWLDDMGVEISESFRVTESGAEVLVDFPRELLTKPNIRLA